MDSTSFWKTLSKKNEIYPALDQNIEVDVVIIGGGITGVTAAAHLLKVGKKVAILESDRIGGVTTGSSTGNLYIAVQPYYQNIISKFDFETAKTIAHSRKYAIDFIEATIQEKNIKCHFSRRPWYIYTNSNDQISFLEKEVDTFKKMEIPTDYISELPLDFKFKKAAVMSDQARFNPLQYVIDLAADLTKQGCQIYEETHVISYHENKTCVIETSDGYNVKAKQCIIATHSPIGINPVQLFTAAYRSYVVAAHFKKGKCPEGHFWDLEKSHHATCTHALDSNEPEMIMVAGNHHRTGQDDEAEKRFLQLKKFLKDKLGVEDFSYQWSAQHFHAADNVPYIGLAGHSYKNTYIATGYFADGLVYGTLAGLILSNLIQKKNEPLEDTYQSQRLHLIASLNFLLKENLNTLGQYYRDIPGKEFNEFAKIKTGDAKVVDINREKWGVYRDEKDKLHIVSAVCTHMKCIVKWNNAEKSWDCPCHGSRFSHEGKVLEGPAERDLLKKEV